MKRKQAIISIVLILLGVGILNAQESPVVTGAESTGSGGTASYSIGLIFYTTDIGSYGSVAKGVQQPYEISEILGINETTNSIEISVYPNPTENFLTLETEDNSKLSYQLFDLQGKAIENKKVNSTYTFINMELLPKATYLLKVTENNKIIRTFKIFKN